MAAMTALCGSEPGGSDGNAASSILTASLTLDIPSAAIPGEPEGVGTGEAPPNGGCPVSEGGKGMCVVSVPVLPTMLAPAIANEFHRESSLVAEGETQANQPP